MQENMEKPSNGEPKQELQKNERGVREERDEQNEWKKLSAADKVRGILSQVRQPATKGLILEFSGLDMDSLNEKDRKEIDSIFEGDETEKRESEHGTLYLMTAEANLAWIERVGSEEEKIAVKKQVNSQIADTVSNSLFGESDSDAKEKELSQAREEASKAFGSRTEAAPRSKTEAPREAGPDFEARKELFGGFKRGDKFTIDGKEYAFDRLDNEHFPRWIYGSGENGSLTPFEISKIEREEIEYSAVDKSEEKPEEQQ